MYCLFNLENIDFADRVVCQLSMLVFASRGLHLEHVIEWAEEPAQLDIFVCFNSAIE